MIQCDVLETRRMWILMSALEIVFNIILILSSLVMIITVLLQSSESSGLGSIAGGAETFFGKNKARSMDGKLALITKIATGVFIVAALLTLILV